MKSHINVSLSQVMQKWKKQELSNLPHTYCDAYHAREIFDRLYVTSSAHLFNGNDIYWCANKKCATFIISSNVEATEIYTGVFYQNFIRNFYRSIGYPIRIPSKIYEDNQAKVLRILADRTNLQPRPLVVLITALHNIYLEKTFGMADTRSKIQLADLNSKPHGGKILRDIADRAIGVRFYSTPGLKHYKPLRLDRFCGSTHINVNHRNNDEAKVTWIW